VEKRFIRKKKGVQLGTPVNQLRRQDENGKQDIRNPFLPRIATEPSHLDRSTTGRNSTVGEKKFSRGGGGRTQIDINKLEIGSILGGGGARRKG